MIFSICLTQVHYIVQQDATGIITGQLTSANTKDFSVFYNSKLYIAENGTIMGKGIYNGLLDRDARYEYVSTGIDNVVQLARNSPDGKIVYVTTFGRVYEETTVVKGKLQFQEMAFMPEGVIKIIFINSLTYVLTKKGIYTIGTCVNYLCATYDYQTTQINYTILPIDQFIQNNIKTIEYYEFSDLSQQYLFIYLNNGDVWALGNNTNGYLPAPYPDKGVIRKVGNGIRNIQIGYNVTRVEYSLYYMNGTELTVYSRQSNPTTRVIERNVYDFQYQPPSVYQISNLVSYQTSFLLIKEQSVENLAEISTFLKYNDLFCHYNLNDTLCQKVANEEYRYTDCPSTSTEKYCQILYCASNIYDKMCITDSCNDNNYTCLAIYCGNPTKIQGSLRFTKGGQDPRCYFYYQKSIKETQFENAKDYIFQNTNRNHIISQVSYSESKKCENNKISNGGAAVIAIFVCLVVFAIVLGVLYIAYKQQPQKVKKAIYQSKFQTIAI
ncbi:Hypothetical_protein [Hexamita inflata]|uniref:Hypothetical_protein n=1 Tax=Hexamita inflata TaxID=28002 RepID=A0AA86US74_9EUKA|nr:Hypothetical protein HINF_LOCUS50281 [Hexamita inflata]